jgi:hypothetical protein
MDHKKNHHGESDKKVKQRNRLRAERDTENCSGLCKPVAQGGKTKYSVYG